MQKFKTAFRQIWRLLRLVGLQSGPALLFTRAMKYLFFFFAGADRLGLLHDASFAVEVMIMILKAFFFFFFFFCKICSFNLTLSHLSSWIFPSLNLAHA